MNKQLIFFTTHKISKAIIREFKKWLNIEGYDAILALDNTNKTFSKNISNPIQELEFYGENYKCFLFDENIHNSLNLPNYTCKKDTSFKEIMWSNGDYRFYYIRKYFPQYDYYWQTEYDIVCNGTSYKPFLDKYTHETYDLIIQEKPKTLIPEQKEWHWFLKSDWVYKNVKKYRSFYPIERLSAKAIDFLYKKRLEHAKIYSKIKDKTRNRWIMCELFTPTELINNGFSHLYLEENLYFSPEIDFYENEIFEKPDNKLYHPVKRDYVKRIDKLTLENKKLKQQIKELSHHKINLFGIKIKIKRNLAQNLIK